MGITSQSCSQQSTKITDLLETIKTMQPQQAIREIHTVGVSILESFIPFLEIKSDKPLKPHALLDKVVRQIGLDPSIEKLFIILLSRHDVESKYSDVTQIFKNQIQIAKQLINWFKSIVSDNTLTALNSEQLRQILRAQASTTTLNEALTRIVIDYQLNQAGWQACTESLTYKKGIRPQKNKNIAIAEWPTYEHGEKGRADYVLFKGLVPIAVLEAKKENEDVSGKIEQAERYSRGFQVESPMLGAWTLEKKANAWSIGEKKQSYYSIPFVYSSNGRSYHSQLPEKSGVWFRDVRHPSYLKRALMSFHTPDGLEDLLTRNLPSARNLLVSERFDYLKLYDFQVNAIQNIELALEQGKNHILIAMATGTGKTRTALGLIYRLLKAERFKRILFVVDRNTLGKQAYDKFSDVEVESQKKLTQIYNVASLEETALNSEVRLQVATVQALNKRIFASSSPYSVDQFDCIIVDEAHRGYTLDQEMTEGEIAVRDEKEYVSSYRRVLDYFDAVKIGLTATPALHTVEIFDRPVFTYSYREAVAAGYLIDHEPPTTFKTKLSEAGIDFKQGEQVETLNRPTGAIDTVELEDELHIDLDGFNRRVITPDFDRVICEALAEELDPLGNKKTLIFCVTDEHADRIKIQLDKAFKALHGTDYDQAAVKKITGKSDKVDQLIKEYKTTRYPNIAITVDLLTTGIDVPEICNLVFMRRVKSRILYEQMLGRATRTCSKIHKSAFKIYDPVGLYASLEKLNTMKPVVKDPSISLEKLIGTLTQPITLEKALNTQGDTPEQNYAETLIDQISQKIMRVVKQAHSKQDKYPMVKNQLNQIQDYWGIQPKDLPQYLRTLNVNQAVDCLKEQSELCSQLNEIKRIIGNETNPVISQHQDRVLEIKQTYRNYHKPEDYLKSFEDYIQQQVNQNTAIKIIATRPRDLTRKQLKEVRIFLDKAGYTEAQLSAAHRQQTNQDIVACILGYIRQAAIGEALVPFEQRVQQAMDKIYQSQQWNPAQKKWLERIKKYLIEEKTLDQASLNHWMDSKGGFNHINKRNFNNKLSLILDQIHDNLWELDKA